MPFRPTFRRSTLLATSLVLALSLGASSASSQTSPPPEVSAVDRATARALLEEGDRRSDAKDYAGALQSYEAAHAIMHAPGTGIEVARAHLALGHLLAARDAAFEVVRMPVQPNEPAAFTKARSDAAEMVRSLGERLPALTIEVVGPPSGTTLDVKIDGAPVTAASLGFARRLDPGKHVVEASAEGWTRGSSEVTLAEREQQKVTITLRPVPGARPIAQPQPQPQAQPKPKPPERAVPAAAPPPAETEAAAPGTSGARRTLLIGGIVAGGVGVAVGTVTGLMAWSKSSDLKDRCGGYTCPPAQKSDLDSAKTLATVSTGAFVLGGIGAAATLGALLWPSSTPQPAQQGTIQPFVGLGSAGVRGSF